MNATRCYHPNLGFMKMNSPSKNCIETLRGAKFTVQRCAAVGSLLPPRGAVRRCAAASSLFVAARRCAALTSLHRGAAPTSLLRGANFSYILFWTWESSPYPIYPTESKQEVQFHLQKYSSATVITPLSPSQLLYQRYLLFLHRQYSR